MHGMAVIEGQDRLSKMRVPIVTVFRIKTIVWGPMMIFWFSCSWFSDDENGYDRVSSAVGLGFEIEKEKNGAGMC